MKAAMTIAGLISILGLNVARPPRRKGSDDEAPKTKRQKSSGLQGAGQHMLAEVQRMSNEVLATYEQVAKYPLDLYSLVDDETRAIRWDGAEEELIEDLLLVSPRQVAGSINLARSRWAGQTRLSGYDPDWAGTAMGGGYYYDEPVKYSEENRQGNVRFF